ncbi:MAG: acyl-[acyl-carrier-protein] thioesterase [Faecalibacterium sp.]
MNQYVETTLVRNADADFRRSMKPSALLRCVEQVSTDHARMFGMDDAFFDSRHVAFLIGRQSLRFTRVPRRGEKLTLTTAPEQSRRGSLKRITAVTDAAGQEVALVDCRWILVDTERGHILREPTWSMEGFANETVEGELPQLVHRCKELTRAGVWEARYSLCDLNAHINNSCYLDIACDALPPEILSQGPVTFASIKYNHEVPMGESMEVFYGPSENGWYVVGQRESHHAFECYLEITPEP